MGLLDRLNKALDKKNLRINKYIDESNNIREERVKQAEEKAEEQAEEKAEEQEKIYIDVKTIIENAENCQEDEFGIRQAKCKKIGLDEFNLPLEINGYMIDDIQKDINNIYHVHFMRH